MTRASVFGAFLLIPCYLSAMSQTVSREVIRALPATPSRAPDFGKLPISFEANQGQTDPSVRFLARGSGYSLFLTESAAVLSFSRPIAGDEKLRSPGRKVEGPPSEAHSIRMELVNCSPVGGVEGEEQLPGIANYFIGNDPAKWHRGVPTYGKVRYAEVYPGIDLVYYGNQRQLEYDFHVAPHAEPKAIRLHFAGARRLMLNASGDLTLIAGGGRIAFHKPVVYQELEGKRQPVDGRFTMVAKNTVGFALGSYDHDRPVVIDPTLAYSTYLGGSGGGDSGNAIAVDGLGFAYVAGSTLSADFPTTYLSYEPSGTTRLGGAPITNAFITKMDLDGTGLIYSTYLSGSQYYNAECTGVLYGGSDVAHGIALDASGNAYVAGCTSAVDFPTTRGAFQTVSGGAQTAFITELDSTGSTLVYSSLLGGSSGDVANAIALDSQDNVYIGGTTLSNNFPVTAGAFQKARNGNTGFVAKLNATGTALLYATFIGSNAVQQGNVQDAVVGIAVDQYGSAYVTGSTASKTFPTTPFAFQSTNMQMTASGVCPFVAKLNSNGSGLLYATYLGGTGGDGVNDYANGVAVDAAGNAFITGSAGSANFPTTPGSFQPINNTHTTFGENAFIAKLNAAGSGLIYSTFLGGVNSDSAAAIVLDSIGNAYITGNTNSSNFPITSNAYQKSLMSNGRSGNPAFLSQLSADGSKLLYSSFLGGSANDHGYAVAVDFAGNAYITGRAGSLNFPTTPGAFQTTNKSQYGGLDGNAFVAKFTPGSTSASTTTIASNNNPQDVAQTVTFTAFVQPTAGVGTPTGTVTFAVDGISATPVMLDGTAHASYSVSTLGVGTHIISASYSGDPTYSASNSSSLTQIINLDSQTISFTGLPTTAIYGTAGPYALNAMASSGLPVSYSISGPALLSGSTLTITGVGSVAVAATQGGNAMYSAATPITQTIIVTAPLTVGAGTITLVTTTTLSRQGGGSYLATVTVTNSGTGTAPGVLLTGISLGGTNGTPLPQALGDILAGGHATTTVLMPASAGASGTAVMERLAGTYAGGMFGGSLRASLPY